MENLIQHVVSLHETKQWREILKYSGDKDANKLLWVWPDETNLQFFKNLIQEFRLKGIISIGCGSGLLEWFLQQYTGFDIIGYEVNREWWCSKYSAPQFIELKFPQQPPIADVLHCDYALMFCYFNDGVAFREYIANYEGNFVIIVGPGYGAGRHTDPEPFRADFGSQNWILYKSQQVQDSKNFIAIYARINSNL